MVAHKQSYFFKNYFPNHTYICTFTQCWVENSNLLEHWFSSHSRPIVYILCPQEKSWHFSKRCHGQLIFKIFIRHDYLFLEPPFSQNLEVVGFYLIPGKMGPIASLFLLKYKSLNLLLLLYQTGPIRWTFVTHHLCYFSFEIVHIWLSIVSFHLRRYFTLQMTTFRRRRTHKDAVRILFQTCDISLTNSACKLERTIFNAIIRTLN